MKKKANEVSTQKEAINSFERVSMRIKEEEVLRENRIADLESQLDSTKKLHLSQSTQKKIEHESEMQTAKKEID